MKTYFFIRRHLLLNTREKTFNIYKDEILKEQGTYYEEALERLLQKIDAIEGRNNKIPNNGYPLDIITPQDRAIYHANFGLVVLNYENQNRDKEGDNNWENGFIEELQRIEGFNQRDVYQGIYLDPYLMYPQGLTIEDLRQNENHLNYIFYPEGGRYKGELHKYLYLDTIVFKGEESDIGKWHFQMKEIEIPNLEVSEEK
ncbi:hypothetical protein CACET_c10910 [Clostridium aceticum]|uniref:Uncharacterized protein n=1 Tax=Clostridium aceticum TaxID=84022 RepID=A0A0D8I5W5_9CLOT|nr:hypothetical protein [Clostridium aceticum]AKL94574.1 hypothetical protein CACET_c10910 [Clostridium aceticum]KJF25439.1 hypothetical protein TZ02_18700 [Clostridium aceticum]